MQVLVTATYLQALDDAIAYLLDVGALSAAQQLEMAMLDHWPELLSDHPHAGRDYAQRNLPTLLNEQIRAQVLAMYGEGAELREIIEGDYLALYAIRNEALYLLTVRHHRQSGYEIIGA
ncbi:MAG: type II toxin-antitoxin system RelE/ParE family toxin [Gallionellaceae bacterium]|jgi:plasmid stabilization system protein ParE|nr:type II toxin-antitoxin system RelE/ParE family toxin [Gallionellaceae bacterium]